MSGPIFGTPRAQMCGVNLKRIDGIDAITALAVVHSTGGDITKLPGDKHFASWLGLFPAHEHWGRQRVIGAHPALNQPGASGAEVGGIEPVAQRLSARSLLPPHLRADKQTQRPSATAHKLAQLVCFMLTQGDEFVDQGQEKYEQQQSQRSVAALKRRAAALGFVIAPTVYAT